jgi:hypothetical protein
VTGAIFCFALGAMITWMGWRHWRYRNEETISVLEAAIMKTTGVEPSPRSRLDHFLTYIQAFLGFVLGPSFMLIGAAGILTKAGVL